MQIWGHISGGRATRLLTLSVLSAALLLTGYVTPGTPVAYAANSRSPAAPISHARYVAVVKTLKASLLLDSGTEAKWRKTFRVSCERVNTRDPFLRAYRRMCLAWASIYDAGGRYDNCSYLSLKTKNPIVGINLVDKCQGRAYDYEASLNLQFIRVSKKLDNALNRYVHTKACRKPLYVSPAMLRFYRRSAAAMYLMGRGKLASSPKETDAAATQLEQLAGLSHIIPTNHQQLSEFRANCR